jgi:hypothetical protein
MGHQEEGCQNVDWINMAPVADGDNPLNSKKDEEFALWQNISCSVTLVIEMPLCKPEE